MVWFGLVCFVFFVFESGFDFLDSVKNKGIRHPMSDTELEDRTANELSDDEVYENLLEDQANINEEFRFVCWRQCTAMGGVLSLILSAFCFSVMALLVSLEERVLPTTELLFARGLFQLIAGALVIRARLKPNANYFLDLFGVPSQRIWLVLRGSVGALSLFFFYLALARLPLSDVSFLSSTVPVWAGIGAFLILREHYGLVDAAAAALTVAGVLFIAHPSFIFGATAAAASNLTAPASSTSSHDEEVAGTLFALCSAISAALVYILIRKIGVDSSADCQIFYWGFAGIVLAPILVLVDREYWLWPPTVIDWLLVLAIGATAYLSQYFFNVGTALEKAAVASSVRNSSVVFTLIWQLLVLGVPPHFGYSMLGGALIFIAVAGLSAHKLYLAHHTQSPPLEEEME